MLEGVLKALWSPLSIIKRAGFNPWYVGGGVKSVGNLWIGFLRIFVSILGMLEGVLKANPLLLKRIGIYGFQSLVCWRGC